MALPAYGRPDLLLFACPKRSRQEKGHPSRAPSGILPPGTRSACGFSRRHIPVPARKWRASCAPPFGLILQPLAARQGAPLRGHPGRAGLAAPTMPQQGAPARGAALPLRRWHCAQIPCVAPSSAGSRRGKAWMFERMDARVHAGRRVPSNAGHRFRAAASARQSGRLLFGYFLLARQEKVTRAGRRPDRNALDLAPRAVALPCNNH